MSREPVCLLPSLFLLLGPWQHLGGGPQPPPWCSESPSEFRARRDPNLLAQQPGFPFVVSAGSGASCISWSSDVSCSRPVALSGGILPPGNILPCPAMLWCSQLGVGAPGVYWREARGAAGHPRCIGPPPTSAGGGRGLLWAPLGTGSPGQSVRLRGGGLACHTARAWGAQSGPGQAGRWGDRHRVPQHGEGWWGAPAPPHSGWLGGALGFPSRPWAKVGRLPPQTPLAYDTFHRPCPSFAVQWGHQGGFKKPR